MQNPANAKFEKLLEPGYIGKVKTRNRIIKSASGLGTGFGIRGSDTKGATHPESPMPKGPTPGRADAKGAAISNSDA